MQELWRYRALALNFFVREIRGRYIGTASGLFWVLIHPLALLAIYAAVFTTIFRVNVSGTGADSFVVFVALGLWPWLAFQEGVLRGALAVQSNAGLIKKVAFPNELLVHGAISATMLIHLLGFMAALVVMALLGQTFHFGALWAVLLILLMQLAFTLGLGLFLAALQVLLKDVEHFLSPLLMIWFYATPVLYTLSMLPQRLQPYMQLNPMTYPISRIRELLLHGGGLVLGDAVLFLAAVLTLLAGRWFFNRLSSHFEDFL